MPDALLQRYRMLPEQGADEAGIEELALRLRESRYAPHGLSSAQSIQVEWLAGLVRGLDAELAELDFGNDPKDWHFPDYRCSVIPVRRDYRMGPGRLPHRRAMRFHAICPEMVGSLSVEIVSTPDVATVRDATSLVLGAGLFDDVSLTTRGGTGRFHVTRVTMADRDAAIDAHITAALDAGCDILCWPELTLDGDGLDAVRARLTRNVLTDSRRIALSLAGSWHMKASGARRNRCTILHAKATPLATYDKRRIFDSKKKFEDIVPGDTLLVIVLEDRLVAPAICRDFCDDTGQDCYDAVDVDVVIVPSMGNANTLDAHRAHASSLKNRRGSRAMIAQQQVARQDGVANPMLGADITVALVLPDEARSVGSTNHFAAFELDFGADDNAQGLSRSHTRRKRNL